MDFSTLQTAVNGQYNAQNSAFAFDPAPYASTAIDTLLTNIVFQQTWTLIGVTTPPQIDTTHTTITVNGTVGNFYGQTNSLMTLVFFLDQPTSNAQVLIKLNLPTGWSFSAAFPQLQATIYDDIGFSSNTFPKYVFTSADFTDSTLENGTFVTGMNFYGDIAPKSTSQTFGYLMNVLGKFVNTTAVGPISIFYGTPAVIEGGIPTFAFTLGFQNTLSEYFPILDNHVEIQLVCNLFDVNTQVGLLLGTTFDFGNNKSLNLYTILNTGQFGVLTFTGIFENVPLPSPTEFVHDFEKLIGANDLYSSLPDQYQSSSDLYLKAISLGIGLGNVQPVFVSLQIGMPANDPGWNLEDVATISQVNFFANVQNPFDNQTRALFMSLGGELTLETSSNPVKMVANAAALFSANQPSMYRVQAGLAPGSALTLPVGSLVQKYLPTAVNLPDITLSQLGFNFIFQTSKNHYGIYAALDKDHPLQFQFGGATVFEVLYASFHIENDSNNGSPGGGLVGAIKIFSFETDFSYQAPGDFKITAQIPSFDINITDLANGLLGTTWDAPSWLPTITFPQTNLFILRQGSGASAAYTFAMIAKPSFGAVIFQVLKPSTGNWVFALGLELDQPKIAAFDSLSMLNGMDAMFKVNQLIFVVASDTMPNGFQFPPTAQFAGATGNNIQIPTWAGQVKGGFYFYGSMTLNVQGTPNLALVQKMFDLDTALNFQLFVFIGLNPAQNALVQAGFQGTINKKTTISGYIGARMEDEEPQFYLQGVISTNIQTDGGSTTLVSCKQPDPTNCLTAGVVFELTPNAAFLSVSMIGKITFGPITLADVVIVVGIDFEGIPSLGFAAQIDLSVYNTTYDSSIAFFFDSSDPDKSMFAGSISDVTLGQIFDTIVGVVTGGDQPPQWMTDLLSHIGVSGTGTFYLPSSAAAVLNARDFAGISTAFNQATRSTQYNFTRTTTLLIVGESDLNKSGVWYLTDFPASNVITHYEVITQNDGRIAVSLEPQFYYCMPPGGGSVVLGPPTAGLTFNAGVFLAGQLDFFMLHIEAQLNVVPNKGFAIDVEVVDPVIIIPNYLQMTGNEDTTRGPDFSVSTYTVQRIDPNTGKPVPVPPHFYLDGKIDLLGLEVATTINISAKGLLLDVTLSTGTPSLGADLSVNTSLSSATGFSFEIAGDVHINNPHFELFNTDLGTLNLVVDISTSLSFGANANDIYLRLSDTTFNIEGTTFTIPGIDLDVQTQKLSDLPGIIYDEVKNLIWDFLKDAAHWLEWVGKQIITGFKDIEQVLEDVFNAIASVWGNEKRIVVAVYTSLTDSQSVTITITPPTPTGTVTQAMIDSAHEWAEQTSQFLVTQAIVQQIKQVPPENIGDFQVNVVQDIDATYELSQNVNWFATPQGELPSLTALGYTNPFSDARFYTLATGQRTFQTIITPDADFANVVSRVQVAVRYNGVQAGNPYTYTSAIGHQFSAPWVSSVADNYEVQYTVSYLNTSVPPVNSGWMKQQGSTLVLPIPTPAALTVTFDASHIPFDRYQAIEIPTLTFVLPNHVQTPAHMTQDPFLLNADQPRLTIKSEGLYAGVSYSYIYSLKFTDADKGVQTTSPVIDSKPVIVIQPPDTPAG